MIGTPVQKTSPLRAHALHYILPFSIGGLALTVAILGAALTGDDNLTGGINGFIEGLSGGSSSRLGSIAPLGIFAFAAGMVATVNPCGFAMLPAYLGLYLGSNDSRASSRNPVPRLAKALLIGLVVTSGFVLLFGITGIVFLAGAEAISDFIGWIGLSIGILLTIGGSWLLGGGKLYSSFASRAASHMGNPGQVSVRGYFMFGLSYGTASLSCTLPIFLSVVGVGVTLTSATILDSLGQFVLYALGMGLVIVLMTLGMAIFKEATVGFLRKTLPLVQPLGAVLMIVAGAYVVYYWLTIGGLIF